MSCWHCSLSSAWWWWRRPYDGISKLFNGLIILTPWDLISWCQDSELKGQKKSKWFFQDGVSSKKMNERTLLYYYETSSWFVFVRFLEGIEDPKKTFLNYLTFTIQEYVFLSTYRDLFNFWNQTYFIKKGQKYREKKISCQHNKDSIKLKK